METLMRAINDLLADKNTSIAILEWENKTLKEENAKLKEDIAKYEENEVNRV